MSSATSPETTSASSASLVTRNGASNARRLATPARSQYRVLMTPKSNSPLVTVRASNRS